MDRLICRNPTHGIKIKPYHIQKYSAARFGQHRQSVEKSGLYKGTGVGCRKSRECSPEIFDFRANGIPTGERVDFFDTLRRGNIPCCYYFRKLVLFAFSGLIASGRFSNSRFVRLRRQLQFKCFCFIFCDTGNIQLYPFGCYLSN